MQQELTGSLRYVIFYYYLHEGLAQIKELIFHNNFQRIETIDSYPANIYDPATFSLFFSKYVNPELSTIPNRRHLLILNGHGAGLGFFAERADNRGIRMITAEQLAASIKQSFGKIDILIAVSCYTQLLETGYAFKGAVDMIVAPQGSITYYGIHYAKLFEMLERDPSTHSKAIAENITGNFLMKYEENYFEKNGLTKYADEQNPNLVSLSANYLNEYDGIVDCVNELTDFLMGCFEEGGEELLQAVIRARRSCKDLTPSGAFHFIDLTFFLDQLLKEAGPVQPLQQIHQRFGIIRQRCIAALHKPPGPPDLYASALRKRVRSTSSPLFLSIFFPAFFTSAEQMAIREIYYSTDGQMQQFRSNCRWEKFIRVFFNKT